jgi:hypothetical protein
MLNVKWNKGLVKQFFIIGVISYTIFMASGGPAFIYCMIRGEAAISSGLISDPETVYMTGPYFLILFGGFMVVLFVLNNVKKQLDVLLIVYSCYRTK